MNPKAKQLKMIIHILGAGVVFSAVLFVFFVYRVFSSHGELNDMRRAEAETKKKLGVLTDIYEFASENPENAKLLDSFFLDSTDVLVLPKVMAGLAENAGIEIDLRADKNLSSSKKVFFRLEADGNEVSLRKFIELLAASPHAFVFEDIVLQKKDAEKLNLPAGEIKLFAPVPPLAAHLSLLISVEVL